MKQTTHRRGDGFLQIASILSASLTLAVYSATAQSLTSQADTSAHEVEETRFPVIARRFAPVIEEEARQGPVAPFEQVTVPTPLTSTPRLGYGPGERILFPPTCGYRDVWTLFYLDKDGELCFAFPMSKGTWGTGDWFGLRYPLVDRGVSIIGSYGADFQGNVSGGLSRGFAYADNIDLRLDLDMHKLVGWYGAHLIVSCLDRNGKNLTQQNVGNQFNVADLWGDETINYYGLWLDQYFFEGTFDIKLGRMAATDAFTCNPLIYGLYMSNAIDAQPTAVAVSGFVSVYPAAVWGTRLRINHKKRNLYTMFGIYQTTNRLYLPAYHGLDFSIRRNDGMNLLWEVGWIPEFQPHPRPASAEISQPMGPSPTSVIEEQWHGMLGHYKFGIFYTPWRDIPQFLPKNTFYAYGFYWLFDQMVYQAVPGTTQGLTLWTAFVYAPQQNTSLLTFQASGGAIYTGLIPSRRKDQLIFGIFYGTFSSDYATTKRVVGQGNPTYELVLEVGYHFNLSRFFYIAPDVQYVIRPGGTGRIPNAWVIGAQIGFSF